MRPALAAAMGLAAVAAAAQAAVPETQRNFVACPMVLDTPDVPCWVAEWGGERYFLTVQTGRGRIVYSPQLKHRVLVEGTVQDGPRICGGVVLKDLKLSVFPEVEPDCGKLLPAGGYRAIGPRPVGPDGDRAYVQGTASRLARETTAIRVQLRDHEIPEKRQAYYKAARAVGAALRFTVSYDFNSNYLQFTYDQGMVEEAADYAVATRATRVEVVGYRGQSLLSDGGRLIENDGLAEARAKKVGAVLQDLGVPASAVSVRWVDVPEDQGGVRDYEKRRVVISVRP